MGWEDAPDVVIENATAQVVGPDAATYVAGGLAFAGVLTGSPPTRGPWKSQWDELNEFAGRMADDMHDRGEIGGWARLQMALASNAGPAHCYIGLRTCGEEQFEAVRGKLGDPNFPTWSDVTGGPGPKGFPKWQPNDASPLAVPHVAYDGRVDGIESYARLQGYPGVYTPLDVPLTREQIERAKEAQRRALSGDGPKYYGFKRADCGAHVGCVLQQAGMNRGFLERWFGIHGAMLNHAGMDVKTSEVPYL
ncbi:MAG TPA: hypothetical protein VIT22_07365 [Pseudoxanthomonas sp.]